MIALHDMLDGLLEILADNGSVDMNVVFRDLYYGKADFTYFSKAMNHLIDEGYADVDAKTDHVHITDMGRKFIFGGGYSQHVHQEIEKHINEQVSKGLDPKKTLDGKTYLGFMNFPDGQAEREKMKRKAINGFYLMILTWFLLWLVKYFGR